MLDWKIRKGLATAPTTAGACNMQAHKEKNELATWTTNENFMLIS